MTQPCASGRNFKTPILAIGRVALLSSGRHSLSCHWCCAAAVFCWRRFLQQKLSNSIRTMSRLSRSSDKTCSFRESSHTYPLHFPSVREREGESRAIQSALSPLLQLDALTSTGPWRVRQPVTLYIFFVLAHTAKFGYCDIRSFCHWLRMICPSKHIPNTSQNKWSADNAATFTAI
jgi:hypothetical protein